MPNLSVRVGHAHVVQRAAKRDGHHLRNLRVDSCILDASRARYWVPTITPTMALGT